MKKVLSFTATALLASLPLWGYADDTEIFFADPASVDASAPYVMLSTELRPNTGSSICSDVESTACQDKLTFDGDAGPWYAMRCIMDKKWFFSAQRQGLPGPETADSTNTAFCDPSYTDVDFRELLILSLYLVFIDLNNVNIGFMLPHDDNKDSNGGYILSGFRKFEKTDTSWDANGNKSRLLNMLKLVPSNQTLLSVNANISHSWQAKEMFFEFYRYLTGQAVLNGHKGLADFNTDKNFNIGECRDLLTDASDQYTGSGGLKGWAEDHLFDANSGAPTQAALDCMFADSTEVNIGEKDGAGNPILTEVLDNGDADDRVSKGQNVELIPPMAGADLTIVDSAGTTYKPGIVEDEFSCSGVYTVNATFAVNQFDDDSDSEIAQSLTNGGLGLNDPEFVDVVRRLRTLDPNDGGLNINLPGNDFVKSYFIVNTNGAANRARDWAVAGGTNSPFMVGDDPTEFAKAFEGIFDQINAVTSTFTAVSVPVNVQNRIQALNQLFLAVFVPDDNGYPVWPGNLKKLKIEFDDVGSSVSIVDALGNNAFNPDTGRLDDNALTFWTDPTGRDVVDPLTDPEPNDPTTGEVIIPAGRDGSGVNRGGSGQNIPGYLEGTVADHIGLCNDGANTACDAASPRQVFIGPESVTPPTRAELVPLDSRFTAGDTALLAYDSLIWNAIDADGLVTFFGTTLNSSSDDDKRAEATSRAFKWMRGFDIFDVDADGETGDVRSWIMGDILHSRPLTLNYGETVTGCGPDSDSFDDDTGTCNPDIRVVFGTNDGFLHMVQSTVEGAGADQSGKENWAFMPRELLGNVQSWMTNENFAINRPYGVDGAVTSLVIDNNDNGIIESSRNNSTAGCTNGADDCDKVYLYFGLRRGGESVYGLDISNKDDEPGMLWHITPASTGFEDLGLTFSDPRTGFFRYENNSGENVFTSDGVSTNVPVGTVVFGGGYWGGPQGGEATSGTPPFDYSGYVGKDNMTTCPAGEHPTDPTDTATCTAVDAKGNAIYMAHARTGEMIWRAIRGTGSASNTEFQVDDLDDSIVAPVTMVPSTNENGIVEIFYVADTGGNVWRIDAPRAGSSAQQEDTNFRADNWTVTKIAELGLDGSDGQDRRFFAAMDIARTRDDQGRYLGLLLISGDRAHPRTETDVRNTAFMIKDRHITPGNPDGDGDPTTNTRQPVTLTDLANVSDDCLTETARQTSDVCQMSEGDTSGLINGWYFDLGAGDELPGEKGFTQPLIGFDPTTEQPVAFFTTYVPEDDDPTSCTANLGFSRLYEVDFGSGAPKQHLSGSTTGTDFVREDRFENLSAGIDGGVTAITPNQGLTSSGRPVEIGGQRPIPKYWRERDVDVLDKPEP